MTTRPAKNQNNLLSIIDRLFCVLIEHPSFTTILGLPFVRFFDNDGGRTYPEEPSVNTINLHHYSTLYNLHLFIHSNNYISLLQYNNYQVEAMSAYILTVEELHLLNLTKKLLKSLETKSKMPFSAKRAREYVEKVIELSDLEKGD